MKKIINEVWAKVDSAAAAEVITKPQSVSGGVKKPFWSDLHLTNIHLSITPDVLHQLYQGVFKHLISWCQDLLGADELDRRMRCLPPAYGVRHFRNGISTLSQISGSERKHMACALLVCLISKISKETVLVSSYRSLLDFIYLAQYPTHDETTLKYMEDALKVFHANKDVLVKLKICEHLNIPKFHSLLHYVSSIRQFGTTDNYNTEMFERLHIDFAKDAWRATNHRNELPQMVKWISRQEKMAMFEVWQKEQQVEANQSLDMDNIGNSVRIAKYPPAPQQHLVRIQERHKAKGLTTTLAQFINNLQPERLRLTRADLSTTWLPFDSLDVYHKCHLKPSSLSDSKEEDDVVRAIPVIFALPKQFPAVFGGGTAPGYWPKGPLAYIEWYSRFPSAADVTHMMYTLRKPPLRSNGLPQASIVPLAQIHRTCQLAPVFPGGARGVVPPRWESDSVLDCADSFHVNNWAGMYTYQTIW
ncbi:hypothetical protein FOMPIDRAFT_1130436 [Fomitopsis schrenkii]|uniref:Uncharacterized protein n=1 Tax=Fomitopsis schrenkii TaxID=2126942 RepID=S8DV13_FOMSC|nr:hypothetical protein FOMPIDRAFT_1130436 [Fomitopsis schrenkii]